MCQITIVGILIVFRSALAIAKYFKFEKDFLPIPSYKYLLIRSKLHMSNYESWENRY